LLRHRRIQEIIDRWCEELISGESPRTRRGSTGDQAIGKVVVTGWSALHDSALAAMNCCDWKVTARASKSAIGQKQKLVDVTFRQAPQSGPSVWPHTNGD
jgi:hypothetical protein